MSQKVDIVRVVHTGSPVFLGYDQVGHALYTSNSHRIMDWLCDGWRQHFNHHRSFRKKSYQVKDENGQFVLDAEGKTMYEDKFLGREVEEGMTPLNNSQLKEAFPNLRSVPSRVFQSAPQAEKKSWNASWKSIKTSRANAAGKKVRLPGFKNRRDFQSFQCFFAGGENANLVKTGRKSGYVEIRGKLKPKDRYRKVSPSWSIRIHVRLTQDIREYTSVLINWKDRTLVFVNPPALINRDRTYRSVGVDRGVVHTLATSDGEFFDIPKQMNSANAEYLTLERSLARKRRHAKKNLPEGSKHFKKSNAYLKTLSEMQNMRKKASNSRDTFLHQTTSYLIKKYDTVVLENLQVSNMTRKGKGSRKRGLNRSILENSWSTLSGYAAYKAKASGVVLELVNPAYTSQTCSVCGKVDKESRKSQSRFECSCGHSENADVNAAKNILSRGLTR